MPSIVNVERSFTIGLSYLVISPSIRDWLSAQNTSRGTLAMVSRCLQASTLASNGCERRSSWSCSCIILKDGVMKLEGVIEIWDTVLAVKGCRKEMEMER